VKRSLMMIAAAVPCAGAAAQTNVDPGHKFCWAENIGWLNWADSGEGGVGVRANPTFFSGMIWSENAGFISLGQAPADGIAYTNASGADAGVNIAPGGELSGFAWGENIGWVTFGTASLGTALQARLDRTAGRLRGWAWGENTGWVNLDDGDAYIAIVGGGCYANCDASTVDPVLNVLDFNCFLNRFAAGESYANCDGSTVPPALNVLDFNCFLNRFAGGCP
jgi:hypothetical protein